MDTAKNKSLEEVHGTVDAGTNAGLLKTIFAFAGPAYMVSVGYMDPGNWATDIAAGSAFGYSLIWVLMMSNLMAILLQTLSARLGIVRGRDLAQASREYFPKPVNFALWILAEVAIAACDLAEVLGLAVGLNLLFGLPVLFGVCISVLDSLLLLMIMNLGIRKMEALIVSLVFIIGMSFFGEMLFAKPNAAEIFSGFIPSMPNNLALYIAIGIIGATVMPHNLYLHSALVQTRKLKNTTDSKWKAIRFNFFDSVIALNLAFFVNAAILILAASVFFKNGLFQVADIKDAHQLLQPLLGSQWAPILFAVALIASGQSSTITGTLAGQIVMEGYLNIRIPVWLRRLITRMVAVVPALLVILIKGESETGTLLIFSQVLLSIQLGFAIIPLIHFVSDKNTMKEFVLKPIWKIISWLVASIIISLNIKLVFDELISIQQNHTVSGIVFYGLMIPVAIAAAALLVYIVLFPWIGKKKLQNEYAQTPAAEISINTKQQFKKIALALDFSKQDALTINQALQIGGLQAEYILIHVVETAGAFMFGQNVNDKESDDDLKKLNDYATQLIDNGFNVHVQLGYGNRVKAISKEVNHHQADLLVMGAHGHRGLKDLLFGETISQVRHHVQVPVLVAR